jgi:hypothetical protein
MSYEQKQEIKYNNWVKELSRLSEEIKEIKKEPDNVNENIERNVKINRIIVLKDLINDYENYKLRESLVFDSQADSSSGNPYTDPTYHASLLASPRRKLDSPRKKGGARKVKVYTGPKNGKYIIKNGSKVYIPQK